MNSPDQYVAPSEAARKLGVSTKALRVYEQRGLISPTRTSAGWRTYGPDEMSRASEIVTLRELGLSLAQIARVLNDEPEGLENSLAAHQSTLEREIGRISGKIEKIRMMRNGLANGQTPTVGDLISVQPPASQPIVAFDLPWPWGGERFELRTIRSLNYIIGPLFSGKTLLARRFAENLPKTDFLCMDQREEIDPTRAKLNEDPDLKARVDETLAWLDEDGATVSTALINLVTALKSEGLHYLVIDLIEHTLDEASQRALIAYLRHRETDAPPLFFTTRSSEILDLEAVGHNETIILCPANHAPPSLVAPHPGAVGYEAVATCLATPDVRARTTGVIAWNPQAETGS